MNTESDILNTEEQQVVTKPQKLTQAEYNKQYYQKNRERTLKRVLQVVCCEICGTTSTYQNLKRHQKGRLCQKRASEKKSEI
jgi:hypothetical protein